MGPHPDNGRPGTPGSFVLAPLARGMGHTLGQALRCALNGSARRVDVSVTGLPASGAPGGERLLLVVHTAGEASPSAVLAAAVERLQQALHEVAALAAPTPHRMVSPLPEFQTEPRWTTGFSVIPIQVLDLGVRATNGLIACDIRNIGDLLACTETDLLRMPNLGRRCLQAIKAALAAFGLVLAAPTPGASGWRR